ncbi:hypothetical protein P7D23_10595 [Lactococcus petauri]|uniref:Uncharacterized protein n=1 Tax=Lactococcus petauri TaxID=1940789 RepID=A0AAJ2MN64_9LACT|nr:hypothetical protein [Lactococcus petauri]MDT2528065.1 hypothetical protein [Lactococcus petauri]MDT2561354.1 hypothetical protein [Lactococcus petauri]MDT2586713.1 hypothetical protein [Lactococcus petauri]MDT2667729.1 hypothetical protein [Lactococcus petauri]
MSNLKPTSWSEEHMDFMSCLAIASFLLQVVSTICAVIALSN